MNETVIIDEGDYSISWGIVFLFVFIFIIFFALLLFSIHEIFTTTFDARVNEICTNKRCLNGL